MSPRGRSEARTYRPPRSLVSPSRTGAPPDGPLPRGAAPASPCRKGAWWSDGRDPDRCPAAASSCRGRYTPSARDELHSLRSLVGDQVHGEAHVAEKLLERRDLGRQAAEHEAPVARHACERHEVVVLGVERGRIAAGPAVLDVDIPPRRIIGPAVIRAHAIPGVPLFGGAQHRALVAADVDEGAET